MKRSPHAFKHQKNKEIRKTQNMDYPSDPKKMKDKLKQRYLQSEKKNKIAKGKALPQHKHHKTSPQEVSWETEPDNAHREGLHWLQVIQKQAKDKTSQLSKKLKKFNVFKNKKLKP